MALPEIPGRREELCAWLTANGINPDIVCELPLPTVDVTDDGEPIIRYTAYLRRSDGTFYESAPGQLARGNFTAPLIVPWKGTEQP
jgi:hypothetical protein